MFGLKRKSLAARPVPRLTFFCIFVLTSSLPVDAKDGLLGDHRINLHLRPLPAAEVIELLSTRSKMVAQLPNSGPSDEGRPWEVEGADRLEGLVVTVDFVATPVQQVVTQLLGCIGFSYTERGNRIVIQKAARALPAEGCQSVTRVRTLGNAHERSEALAERKYSWQFESISALDLIEKFSSEAQQNVLVPFSQVEVLRQIKLRVSVSDMLETEVLKNMFGCIGWTYEKTRTGFTAFQAEGALPSSECNGFSTR